MESFNQETSDELRAEARMIAEELIALTERKEGIEEKLRRQEKFPTEKEGTKEINLNEPKSKI